MNVVIGLGNPGIEYENTVHNAGFRVVDAVRQKVKANYQKGKNFEYFDYNGARFVRPLTFMNLSGEVFRNLFLDNIENLVVICDNIDLAFGALRFKEGGSAGGHNGLKSIIAHNPKGADFFRLYVGGKTDNPYISTVDYVLQKLKGDKFDDFAITCVTASEYLLEF